MKNTKQAVFPPSQTYCKEAEEIIVFYLSHLSCMPSMKNQSIDAQMTEVNTATTSNYKEANYFAYR